METTIILALSAFVCAINWGYAYVLGKRKKRFDVYIDLTTLWMKILIIMSDILLGAVLCSKDFYTYLPPVLWMSIKTLLFNTMAMVAVNWLIAFRNIPRRIIMFDHFTEPQI